MSRRRAAAFLFGQLSHFTCVTVTGPQWGGLVMYGAYMMSSPYVILQPSFSLIHQLNSVEVPAWKT